MNETRLIFFMIALTLIFSALLYLVMLIYERRDKNLREYYRKLEKRAEMLEKYNPVNNTIEELLKPRFKTVLVSRSLDISDALEAQNITDEVAIDRAKELLYMDAMRDAEKEGLLSLSMTRKPYAKTATVLKVQFKILVKNER